jgi:hypothetical protein
MGQSPAPRKRAKSPLMRPRRVRFLSPGDPSRLINSDRFDKTGRSLFSGPASLGASFAKKLADRPLLSLFSSRPTSYRGRIFNFCATATSSLSIFGQIRRPLQLRPAKDGTLAEIFCDPMPFDVKSRTVCARRLAPWPKVVQPAFSGNDHDGRDRYFAALLCRQGRVRRPRRKLDLHRSELIMLITDDPNSGNGWSATSPTPARRSTIG